MVTGGRALEMGTGRMGRGGGAGCRRACGVRDGPRGRRGVLDGLRCEESEVCNYVRYFLSYSSQCLSLVFGYST